MIKRNHWKIWLALWMCFLLLTGCSGQTGERPAAAGRYVEEELPLPLQLKALYYLGITSDKSFSLVGVTQSGEWAEWRSFDAGESWEEQFPIWLSYLEEWEIGEITMDEQDQIWVSQADGAGVYCITGESVQHIPLKLQNDDGVTGQDLMVQNDRMAVSYGYGAVYGAEGSLLIAADTDSYLMEGAFFLTENRYGIASSGGMRLFDLDGGQQIQEIRFQKELAAYQEADFFDFRSRTPLVAATREEGIYSYCNESGIYRVSEDGALHERILAGDLTSLNRPAVSAKKLMVTEDSYFIYATDVDSMPWQLKNPVLLRYRFDETAPVVASVQLRVYSLTDSPTVREAVALYQREHPDVKVKFEVGLTGLDQMEAGDAIRQLTTEILAGKGPDVIVTDGLNVQGFIEKGILAELSELLSEETLAGLLPNLASAFSMDGEIYAVPARFTVPMVLAEPGIVDELAEPGRFAASLAALQSPQIGVARNELFAVLYSMFSEGWFQADGALDEAAALQGLAYCKDILELYDGLAEDQIWNSSADFRAGAIGWSAGWTPVYINRFSALNQLAGPYTVLQKKEGVFQPYPTQADSKAVLQTVVGIYADSNEKEKAAAFVETMLSDQVQALVLGDGLPTAESALSKGVECPYEGGVQRFGVSFYDGFEGSLEKGLTIPLSWPDEAYFAAFISALKTLQANAGTGAAVERIVTQEAESYFSGARSLEETVQSLKQKLELYLAE